MQMTRKWEFKQKGNAGIEKFNALCICSSVHSPAPLRSFVRSFAHSLTPELMGKWLMSVNQMRPFHSILTHCAANLAS